MRVWRLSLVVEEGYFVLLPCFTEIFRLSPYGRFGKTVDL